MDTFNVFNRTSKLLKLLRSYPGWTLDNIAEDPSETGGFISLINRKDGVRVIFDIISEDDTSYVVWRINQVPVEGLDYYAVYDLTTVLENIRHSIEDIIEEGMYE